MATVVYSWWRRGLQARSGREFHLHLNEGYVTFVVSYAFNLHWRTQLSHSSHHGKHASPADTRLRSLALPVQRPRSLTRLPCPLLASAMVVSPWRCICGPQQSLSKNRGAPAPSSPGKTMNRSRCTSISFFAAAYVLTLCIFSLNYLLTLLFLPPSAVVRTS